MGGAADADAAASDGNAASSTEAAEAARVAAAAGVIKTLRIVHGRLAASSPNQLIGTGSVMSDRSIGLHEQISLQYRSIERRKKVTGQIKKHEMCSFFLVLDFSLRCWSSLRLYCSFRRAFTNGAIY
mmetsp:Transcript_3942/g.9000  ORF Transcript_3942/g.9000 Transcript_3942/m.9000 type:complete len:127 (+) Transcript_3942:238-618(+)